MSQALRVLYLPPAETSAVPRRGGLLFWKSVDSCVEAPQAAPAVKPHNVKSAIVHSSRRTERYPIAPFRHTGIIFVHPLFHLLPNRSSPYRSRGTKPYLRPSPYPLLHLTEVSHRSSSSLRHRNTHIASETIYRSVQLARKHPLRFSIIKRQSHTGKQTRTTQTSPIHIPADKEERI